MLVNIIALPSKCQYEVKTWKVFINKKFREGRESIFGHKDTITSFDLQPAFGDSLLMKCTTGRKNRKMLQWTKTIAECLQWETRFI